MGKNLKLAVAALLGFSTACSSVKTAPKSENGEQPVMLQPADSTSVPPRIVAMYGVPNPDGNRAVPYVAPEKDSEGEER